MGGAQVAGGSAAEEGASPVPQAAARHVGRGGAAWRRLDPRDQVRRLSLSRCPEARGARFWTRTGEDRTDRFGALAPAFDPLPCGGALKGGEVVAREVNGSAFSSLQAALLDGGALTSFAFDLLSLDGEDIAARPLVEREDRLARLLATLPPDGPLRLSAHVEGGGPDIFARACATGGEGIVRKRADAPYRSGRGTAWLKVKRNRRHEFAVGGTSPSDKRGRPFASLLVGEYGPDGLRYRGRVGSGFRAEDSAALTDRLRPRKTSPFLDVPRNVAHRADWVEPTAVVEVDFAELNADGQLRYGTYLGLRQDKEAADVTIEAPRDAAPAGEDGSVEIDGMRISHPDRMIFPDVGRTKRGPRPLQRQRGRPVAGRSCRCACPTGWRAIGSS